MAQALVPLKDLVAAKTRLSGLLCPSERRALAQAMVEDVLLTLASHPRLTRVTLVSDDPGAGLLAYKYGIESLDESLLEGRGLNPVLESACERIMPGGDEPLLVLHGDIPTLTHADIDAVLVKHAVRDTLVIGCDRHGVGTNLLAFTRLSKPRFAFGQNSCAAHEQSALKLGITASIMHRAGFALDVDLPEDIARLLEVLDAVNAPRPRRCCWEPNWDADWRYSCKAWNTLSRPRPRTQDNENDRLARVAAKVSRRRYALR